MNHQTALFFVARSRKESSPVHIHRHNPSSSLNFFAIFLAIMAMSAFPAAVWSGDVKLAWDANTEPDLAGYRLYYGTASRQYGSIVAIGNQTTYVVTGLPDGTYYFAVTALNTSGAESSYSNEVSTIVSSADATPPVISIVSSSSVTFNSAAIIWTTNEASDSQVEYGTTVAHGSSTVLDAAVVTAHSQALSGLAASTTYHFRVKSKDAAGNRVASGDFTFTTSAPPDTTPPVISAVSSSSVAHHSTVIAWTTNEASNSQVEYGTTAAYGSSTTLNSATVTAHSQALSGLAASTTYHFRVKSKDAAGNLAASGEFTFTTTAAQHANKGLVAAYAFDEGTGSTAQDSSGGSNNGTLYGVNWTSNARFGKALLFNGFDNYVTAGVTGMPAANSPQTIAFWAYTNSKSSTTQSIIALADSTQGSGVQPGIKNHQVGVWQYGGTWLVAAPQPAPKKWHHYAYTFDGRTHQFYIDGILASSSTVTPKAGNPKSFQMGRGVGSSDYFKGILDELRIYNRALSVTEIQTLMTASVGSSPSPLMVTEQELLSVDPWADSDSFDAKLSAKAAGEESRKSEWSRHAEINIRMSQEAYRPGDLISASSYNLFNPAASPRSIELKTWLSVPGIASLSIGNVGGDGFYVLPDRLEQDYGPIPLLPVDPDTREGNYEFGARMLDPVTGAVLAEDINPFTVSGTGSGLRRSHSTEQIPEESRPLEIENQGISHEYLYGDIVSLAQYRILNTGIDTATIELKVWLEAPGRDPVPVFSLGADGSFILPPGAEMRLDPLPAFRVTKAIPTGTYQLRSRILDPTTGQNICHSAIEFVIR